MSFLFATGIENSYPTIEWKGKTIRQDELEKTKHYEKWREDFELLSELGITHLRYGPAYYRTNPAHGKYDWSFADKTLNALREQKVEVIADLCHFGVPDWIGSAQNPELAKLFVEYVETFVRRYPWVRFYTPVNEIFIAATFSAQLGWWNERLKSDRAFVTALNHLCRANVEAMHAILKLNPDAIFVQSESSQYFHPEGPDCEAAARRYNEKRFLALDLSYGHHVNATIYEYLLDNGMTRDEYHWFLQHSVRSRCIMGTDYYDLNENLVHADGTTSPSGEILGYHPITLQYFNRYRLPVMHTETNHAEPDAARWLFKEWANVHRLRQDGVPMTGFTWYSLQDQVDWDTGLRENNGTVNPLGLCDLDRKLRPVGHAYKRLISQWQSVLEKESSILRICEPEGEGC